MKDGDSKFKVMVQHKICDWCSLTRLSLALMLALITVVAHTVGLCVLVLYIELMVYLGWVLFQWNSAK